LADDDAGQLISDHRSTSERLGMRMRVPRGIAAGLALIALLYVSDSPSSPATTHLANTRAAASSGSWTEYHRDDAHTGSDPTLPQISSVSSGWVSGALDANVYAEPLIYNGLVYAATLNNSVYALDQFTGAVVWQRPLEAPVSGGWVCGNVSPQGILGTPIIDPVGGRIYVVTLSAADHLYRLHGLNLSTGLVELSTVITTSALTGFDWTIQQERGALAFRNGYVYVPFGGRDGDCGQYHGWVFAVPIDGSAVTHYYKTGGSGIGSWAAGGVAVDDATGNVFISTGNGVTNGGPDGCAADSMGNPIYHNDAVEKLSPTLTELDFFMPQDWQNHWCGNDQDLGSAGPMLISSSLIFQAGKWGGGFLIKTSALGGVNGQAFPSPASYAQADVCFGNTSAATYAGFAYAAPFAYVECEGHGLVALNVDTGTPSFTPCGAVCGAPDWSAGGSTTFGPPIVAGGAVWVANDGGGLYAYNATTGALLYHSYGFNIKRFVTPAEAGGQVFVPSMNVIRSFSMNLAWTSVGGVITSGPDPASWAAGRTDVFARGQEGGLWDATWNGSTWSWAFLGGLINADPAAVSWGTNRIDVFVRGIDNALWHRSFDGTSWAPWEKLGGVITSGPDVASWGANRLDVFVRGTEGGLWQVNWDGTSWTWHFVGGRISSDPGAVASTVNHIDVFVRGTEGGLWQTSWNGSSWTWTFLGGVLSTGPDAASCAAGHLDVYATGTEGGLWHRGFNGVAWGPWQFIGGLWTNDPGAVCTPGTTNVQIFERGSNGAILESNATGS
jgi:outer membrane protein assembly factor BamB